MKKQFLLLIPILFISLLSSSQHFVTTNPQLKNVVLEEFTGINCPYCPYGHQAAQAIASANPGRVHIINIHTGYYAEPQGSQPDFTTEYGSSLVSQANIAGYPSGTVNRYFFPDLSSAGGTAMSRNEWDNAADRIFDKASYVNIGLQSTYNSDTRELEVLVDMYFPQGSELPESFMLNLALTENNVTAYQAGGSNSYNHVYILRDMLTGQWGEEITGFEAGDYIQKTYQYELTAEWSASDCELTAFACRDHENIETGTRISLVDGFHDGYEAFDYARMQFEEVVQEAQESAENNFSGEMLIGAPTEVDCNFFLAKEAPEDWSASFQIDGTFYPDLAVQTISPGDPLSLSIDVSPGASAGVGKYQLILSSDDYSELPSKTVTVYVIKGITDMIVNGGGTYSGENSEDYEEDYLDALSATGCTTYGAISEKAMLQAFDKNILSSVNNLYLNVSKTYPSISDASVDYISDFMDNGGNLLIAGPDVAWDAMSTNGYGSIALKMFFNYYLSAIYGNTGDNTMNQVNANPDDPIFGAAGNSNLYSPYSGSLAPDQIYTIDPATAVLYYNENSDMIAAVRKTTVDYKMLYLAFGLEQLSSEAFRDSIMKRTYEWFYDMDSYPVSSLLKRIKIYPMPANDKLTVSIPQGMSGDVELKCIDMQGRTQFQDMVQAGTHYYDTSGLPCGIYLLSFTTGKVQSVNKIVIQR